MTSSRKIWPVVAMTLLAVFIGLLALNANFAGISTPADLHEITAVCDLRQNTETVDCREAPPLVADTPCIAGCSTPENDFAHQSIAELLALKTIPARPDDLEDNPAGMWRDKYRNSLQAAANNFGISPGDNPARHRRTNCKPLLT